MTDAVLPDAEARARIADDHGTTLFVEAAAGTGKTTALVTRMVALLRLGISTLDRMVAVTFTEKAAGEMKLRLRNGIEEARAAGGDDDERSRLDLALGQLELARIGTIHAFCADLLRERPVEAGVDPRFLVAPEDESERLLYRAFDGWFQGVLDDPPPGVARILRRRRSGRSGDGPREELMSAVRRLVDHRDFPAPWRREPFDREGEMAGLLDALTGLGDLAARAADATDYLARNLDEIHRFVREIHQREAVRGRDHDILEGDLREIARNRRLIHWTWRGWPRRPYGPDLPRDDTIARRDAVKADLDAFVVRADAELAALLREELRPVLQAYEELKHRHGILDFLDLMLRARDLVRERDDVRVDLQGRFSHFFVDEFQDTDPLQAELLLLLAADDPGDTDWTVVRPVPGKLFLVGDPKQSIYRFRRADVQIYRDTQERLTARGAEVLHLTTSFRSVPSLQQAVNGAFGPEMSGASGTQAEYVPLTPWRTDEPAEQPAVVVVPAPRPYSEYGQIANWEIDRSLPDAVGGFIDWLLNRSGWTVTERSGGEMTRTRVEGRHICILFRRLRSFRDDVSRPYVEALEDRGIAHVLVGGRSFHDRDEVLALRNALTAIEWPSDELRVFATLRGPLFALGDDVLLAFRQRWRSLHPLRPWRDEELVGSDADVVDALEILARLHYRRNHRPLAETLTRLLTAVRAFAGIAIWKTGDQALANVLRIVDLARRFERDGAVSFRSFVEQLERDAEEGSAGDAPLIEEGTEGVRMMTVHKAKGLEFPVVVLADPSCPAIRAVPTRHIDPAKGLWAESIAGCAPQDLIDAREDEMQRDREEAVRLVYVAATRARDLLIVPGVGDEEREGWLQVLNPAIHPAFEARRDAQPAPGCPRFGDDTVLERPQRARAGVGSSVAPGLHRPRAGDHGVVWWDPAALELDVTPGVSHREIDWLRAGSDSEAATGNRNLYETWRDRRETVRTQGSRPSMRALAVTAIARRPGEDGPPVAVERVAGRREDRPHGVRFGALVHAALSLVSLDGDEDGVRQVVEGQARLVGAEDDEVAAAVEAVAAALAHPLLRRAARAATTGGLRRETPVILRGEGTEYAEGIVDLAFRDDDGWTVVDFKTDVEIEGRREEYEAQVGLYVRAIEAATGESARGVLLVV